MPAKKASTPADEQEPHTIPTPTESSDTTDAFHISISVVANIVKMAALQVDGVYSVGGSFADGIWETLGAKKADRSVEVDEDEAGNYLIKIRVEMRFGVVIAATAQQVVRAIRSEVERMTEKTVAKVEVLVDSVRMEPTENAEEKKASDWEHPHTD